MQENDAVNRELEDALRNQSPKTAKVDPIAAAFAAGQRSTLRKLRVWHSAVAAMLLVNLGLWCWPSLHNGVPLVPALDTSRNRTIGVLSGPSPLMTSTSLSVPVMLPDSERPPLSDQSLAALERTVLERGVDALPVAHVPTQRPVNLDKL